MEQPVHRTLQGPGTLAMKTTLIPEPQYAESLGDRAAEALAAWPVVLRLPAPDERLAKQAASLFDRVKLELPGTAEDGNGDGEAEADADGVYALILDGLELRPLTAERVAGRCDGYVLEVDADRLELYALSASGLFYGMKTLQMLLRGGGGSVPALSIADWADLPLRADYLDLRTVYPTYEHILAYVAEMADYKINTLVVEYEDKLPLRKHAFLRHPEYAFTDEQHIRFLEVAHNNFIQIIPKQQSFGHLEYILKYPAYIRLRETPASVAELCPHRPGSFEMMAGILEEVADLHPHSDYLHMGCDEVWSLGTCEDCRRSGMTREASFIQFVNRLAAKVSSLGKKPMIWHDMLMHATEEELNRLDRRLTVVVWIYGGHRMKRDAREMIRKLRRCGIAVLGASAVRCWDDNGDQNYPVIANRVRNIVDWTELAKTEQLPGIVNTNWGAPFSLGSPYGLFETSRYPAFLAAELNWNSRADIDTYLFRFLAQYHGLDPSGESRAGIEGYAVTDYYALIPELHPALRSNLPTAELIAAMVQFELPAQRKFPLHTFLFRGRLYPDSEEVITCLRDKYQAGYEALAAARVRMQAIVSQLLPPSMTELYVYSRYYRFAVYEEKLLEMAPGPAYSEAKEGIPDA
ncbi:family 20 glycosylhydrolase [Cohnella fermenti]|uniref:Uncharacterized protein n=1 Tax=Cohnella fermenti TaxID=2565925 RepID=A0A4S4C8V2_9BACL|nr:family 20 glycosylhydrolase [Cohnella fermenti]THF84470.1 hypothetical protein E6C55_00345 [Cohnella fermenti]